MPFQAVCRDAVSTKRVKDYRLHHGRLEVLRPNHPDLRELIDTFGFFNILRGSNFDTAALCVAYCRAGEVDWSHSSLGTPFYHYDWETAKWLICRKQPYMYVVKVKLCSRRGRLRRHCSKILLVRVS